MMRTGRKTTLLQKASQDRAWLIMISLPVLYYIIFHYLPMVGVVLAFKDYSIPKGIFGSPWVGFKWFIQFFNSAFFWRLMRNTLVINVYDLIFGFPVPIIFALLLNEMRALVWKRVVQTVSYLPYFISTVIVVGILVNFLSPNTGVVNIIIKNLGGQSQNFMGEQSWFRFLYVGSNIWQYFGFGSIIYLAAIAGISEELYDAARVDGATRLQRMWYVTIPCMAPTITILLILRMGSMLSVGFEKILLMYTPTTYEVSDVIATYVYRRGIISGEYSFAAAISLFGNAVNLLLLVTFNKIAGRFSETTLW
jgi:putative aldouronate transport system permease protein